MIVTVDPGTEKWLPWARSKLNVLRGLRALLGVPALSKVLSPESGVRVHLKATDFLADWIRITGAPGDLFFRISAAKFGFFSWQGAKARELDMADVGGENLAAWEVMAATGERAVMYDPGDPVDGEYKVLDLRTRRVAATVPYSTFETHFVAVGGEPTAETYSPQGFFARRRGAGFMYYPLESFVHEDEAGTEDLGSAALASLDLAKLSSVELAAEDFLGGGIMPDDVEGNAMLAFQEDLYQTRSPVTGEYVRNQALSPASVPGRTSVVANANFLFRRVSAGFGATSVVVSNFDGSTHTTFPVSGTAFLGMACDDENLAVLYLDAESRPRVTHYAISQDPDTSAWVFADSDHALKGLDDDEESGLLVHLAGTVVAVVNPQLAVL